MKFVGFGEIMVRLAPDGYLRFPQVDHFNINYTGAEANMCVSLSYMGMDTEFVTRLPENDIADCAMRIHVVLCCDDTTSKERLQ